MYLHALLAYDVSFFLSFLDFFASLQEGSQQGFVLQLAQPNSGLTVDPFRINFKTIPLYVK